MNSPMARRRLSYVRLCSHLLSFATSDMARLNNKGYSHHGIVRLSTIARLSCARRTSTRLHSATDTSQKRRSPIRLSVYRLANNLLHSCTPSMATSFSNLLYANAFEPSSTPARWTAYIIVSSYCIFDTNPTPKCHPTQWEVSCVAPSLQAARHFFCLSG